MADPDIEAVIYYLTESEGGRTTPVYSGYRGQFYYDGNNWDAPQEFIDTNICELGEYVTVKMKFLSPRAHIGHLFIGKEFEIREGSRIVGKGAIKRILKPEYQKWTVDSIIKKLEETDIFPYSSNELNGIIEDLHYHLQQLNIFKNLKIKKTGSKANMLTITCELNSSDISTASFYNWIHNCWKEKISFKNELHKSLFIENRVEFEFVTWDSKYVTIKIIINKNITPANN